MPACQKELIRSANDSPGCQTPLRSRAWNPPPYTEFKSPSSYEEAEDLSEDASVCTSFDLHRSGTY
ncbi:MAG: hypothetical protein ACE5I5_19785 [Candidatus Heimdallarchaeota archaeon]